VKKWGFLVSRGESVHRHLRVLAWYWSGKQSNIISTSSNIP
jgi:hypothetical protein